MKLLRNYGTLIVCAAAIALVALPATAAAKRGSGILSHSLFAGFALKGSNGYEIEVLTIGGRLALLSASKGQVNASYEVVGKISHNRLKARFGNLGRISVQFVSPPRRKAESQSQCKKVDLLIEDGTFQGTIKFAGEQGFTEVDASHARGLVIGIGKSCPGGKATPSTAFFPTGLTTQLTAVARRAGKALSLDASRFGNDRRMFVNASIQEQRAKMRISRSASAIVGGKNSFASSDVGEHPAFATLKPPKPFSGTGVFTENPLPSKSSPPSSSWGGSIAAWLPGAGKVSLAGRGFASSLCRQSLENAGCSLFPTVQRDFLVAQDSGSQSQALREVMLSWSRYRRNSSSSAGSTP